MPPFKRSCKISLCHYRRGGHMIDSRQNTFDLGKSRRQSLKIKDPINTIKNNITNSFNFIPQSEYSEKKRPSWQGGIKIIS